MIKIQWLWLQTIKALMMKKLPLQRGKEAGLQLIVNTCITRQNIHQVGEIIEFAEKLGANYLEIANIQYYGWALKNINALLPTQEQIMC